MTFRDAWNAIIGPRLRKPVGPLSDNEREARRVGETPVQRLRRIERLGR